MEGNNDKDGWFYINQSFFAVSTLVYRIAIYYSIYILMSESHWWIGSALIIFQVFISGFPIANIIDYTYELKDNSTIAIFKIFGGNYDDDNQDLFPDNRKRIRYSKKPELCDVTLKDMILCQVLYYDVSVLNRLPQNCSYRKRSRFEDKQSIQVLSLLIHFIEGLLLLWKLIADAQHLPNFNQILLFPALLDLLVITFLIENIFTGNIKPEREVLTNSISAFSMAILMIGHFIISHNTYWAIVIDVFSITLVFSGKYITIFLKRFYRAGYVHDLTQLNLEDIVVGIVILLSNFTLIIGQKLSSEEEKMYDTTAGIIQLLKLLILILFNATLVPITPEQEMLRLVINVALFGIIYHIYRISMWNYDYLTNGPYSRKIRIESKSIQNLSFDKVNDEYFRFKKGQKTIVIEFIGEGSLEQIKRFFCLFVKQTGITIQYSVNECHISLKENKFKQAEVHFSVKVLEKRFADEIFELIANEKNNKESVVSSVQELGQITYQQLEILLSVLGRRYFDLVPKILPEYLPKRLKLIRPFFIEVLKAKVFYSQFADSQHFSPQQIYLDLYCDDKYFG